MRPCGLCVSLQLRNPKHLYKVSATSDYCETCIRRGVSCDLIITTSDQARLDRERTKLKKELIKVDEKRLQLRKQLDLFREQERKMFATEIRNIKEVKEEEHRAGVFLKAYVYINDPGVQLFSNVNPQSILEPLDFLPPEGFVVETPLLVQDSLS